MRTREATKLEPHAKRIVGTLGVPSQCYCGEGRVDIEELDKTMSELPGVSEDGMSGKNEQRKPGTTRGSPRRSRTAKTPRINRHAAKSRCAREWGGWGRVSDDGPGHYNPDPSEGPWGGGSIILQAVHYRVDYPTQGGISGRPRSVRRVAANQADGQRMSGADLSCLPSGKALPDRPAFQPYWGKPAVRNDRGD